MKLLITGGLGQIGSHVAEKLLERGDQVLVIDNLATGRREHLNNHPNLSVIIDSIERRDIVYSAVENFKPDVIIHAAASFKSPNDWYSDTITNCVGGVNIIQAAKEFGIKRFIYFQTSLCYGQSPIECPITLSHPLNPTGSSYAISKTTNELYLELSGIDHVTFRLANIIGPRNLAGPLPIFYKRLKEGKPCIVTHSKRDFVYVKDLTDLVLKAVDGIGNGAYHFSTGREIKILELYNMIVEELGFKDYPSPIVKEVSEDDVSSILLDPARTFRDFGKLEFTPIIEVVKDAINYYKKYGTIGEVSHLHISYD